MASLVFKKSRGHSYAYWVRSARVNGKPRIVEQVYLGTKDRFLEELKAHFSRGKTPGPTPLKQLRVKEFGASAWLWHWAQQLELVEIVNRHVPAVDKKRRTQLSVGHYLVIAAVNRAVQARSKRSLHTDWYQHSVVSRLCPAQPGELTSQRFWDHMDQVEPAHIEAIQQDLLGKLRGLFPLGQETLLYDTTNYFTFIDTFNDRCGLAQRGNNKQKRRDLRQLSLALFADEKTGLPLYHQCYRGNQPDVSQATSAWNDLVRSWMKGLKRVPEQLTLVFDKGNCSKKNLAHLQEAPMHYVGSIPGRWVADLLDIDLENFEKLNLPGTKHIKVHRCRYSLWEKERTLLVVFSPSFYRKQRAAMNRLQQKVDSQLLELAVAIQNWNQTRRGSGYRQESVEKKIHQWTARDHLQEFLEFDLDVEDSQVVALNWSWDRKRKREVQRHYLGKTILFTDQHEWESTALVMAYRKLWKSEALFRLSKARRGPWWPLYHWTDSKIRVHALYCYFALLLLSILQLKLREGGLTLSTDHCVSRLQQIQEALVVYTNGSAERVLTHLDDSQQSLAEALGLFDLARQMGNTVLDDS
ncbi:MAG: IS1634 family transposase [Planctomycetota bacterium]|jgi:transposase